jgi:hypothetical protein
MKREYHWFPVPSGDNVVRGSLCGGQPPHKINARVSRRQGVRGARVLPPHVARTVGDRRGGVIILPLDEVKKRHVGLYVSPSLLDALPGVLLYLHRLHSLLRQGDTGPSSVSQWARAMSAPTPDRMTTANATLRVLPGFSFCLPPPQGFAEDDKRDVTTCIVAPTGNRYIDKNQYKCVFGKPPTQK